MTAKITKQDNNLLLSGTLDFTTVTKLYHEGITLLNGIQDEEAKLDLKKVTYCNSAGLALITCWLAYAQHQQNKNLRLVHIPDQLSAIAKICGVDELVKASSHQ